MSDSQQNAASEAPEFTCASCSQRPDCESGMIGGPDDVGVGCADWKGKSDASQNEQGPPIDPLVEAGQFLLDRLVDHEVRITSDDDAREWVGHVTPAMARLRAALASKQAAKPTGSALPIATGSGRVDVESEILTWLRERERESLNGHVIAGIRIAIEQGAYKDVGP